MTEGVLMLCGLWGFERSRDGQQTLIIPTRNLSQLSPLCSPAHFAAMPHSAPITFACCPLPP